MVNNNNLIPKENIAKIVEIRYLEDQETSQLNKFLSSILSTTYCMPDDGNRSFSVKGPSIGVGTEGTMVKTGVDLASVKTGAVETRVGINADTGVSTSNDSLEVKAAGFGVSVGKKMGVSTPFGEVKVDTDDCVVQ